MFMADWRLLLPANGPGKKSGLATTDCCPVAIGPGVGTSGLRKVSMFFAASMGTVGLDTRPRGE